MAKKKVKDPQAPKLERLGTPARVIGSFQWGSLFPHKQAEARRQGVMIAMSPSAWDTMMEEQRIASQARDNLREELRVANLKLSNLETRFYNEQTAHVQHVEALRHELSKAREEADRLLRGMHALIDGIAAPRAQLEVSKRFQQVNNGDGKPA